MSKQVFKQMIERDIGNLYARACDLVMHMPPLAGNPVMQRVAQNYIDANQKKIFAKIDEKIEMLACACCPTPETPLEDAFETANDLANLYIGSFLEENFGMPAGALTLSLQALSGMAK